MQIERNLHHSDEVAFLEPVTATDAGYVNVWTCSATEAREKNLKSRIWVPESYLKLPLSEGVRLVFGSDGYEGQIWNDRALISSRWWSKPPSNQDWLGFIEGASTTSALAQELTRDWSVVPDAEDVAWRSDLSLLKLGRENLMKAISPARLGAVVASILLLSCGYLLGIRAKLESEISVAQTEIAAFVDRASVIAAAQTVSLDARSRIEAIVSAGSPTQVLDLFMDLGGAIQDNEPTVTYFSLSGSVIEVVLQGIDPAQIPSLVERLEDSSIWSSVSATADRNGQVVVRGTMTNNELPS